MQRWGRSSGPREATGFTLPALDRTLSPHTGWTRAHWVAVADQLLDSVQPCASPQGAKISLPGRPSMSGVDSDGLEGYSRTFLLLALRTATEGGRDDLLERYAAGLIAGVDPESPEAWPRITNDVRQTLVEAASLAFCLFLTRDRIWHRLPERTRQQAIEWFRGAFGLTIPDNNWHLFRVVVGEFLAFVGAPHDRAEMTRDLARIEDFWVEDGWYSDGPHAAYDHYCGWAMHTYPALIDLITGPRPSSPVAHVRLRCFLQDQCLLVGANGSPLFQGRSLIYRMAAGAAPWVGALANCTPLSPGQTRRLTSGMLRHFVDRGFVGPNGVPTLGWYGDYPSMVQSYSAPASPFWLAKGFLGLLLPADHPCWTAIEEPLPVELRDDVRDLRAPGWTVSATRADGLVRIANHGSDGVLDAPSTSNPLYSRLAYSTATCPTPDDGQTIPDNHVGLVRDDGEVSHRVRIHRMGAPAAGRIASWHEPSWPATGPDGSRITTISQWVGAWEVRIHIVDGVAPGTEVLATGWQVADESPPSADPGQGPRASTSRLTSVIVPVTPVEDAGVARSHGTSAFGAHGATPWTRARVTQSNSVHVSLVALLGDGSDRRRAPDAAVTDDAVTVRHDGHVTIIPIPHPLPIQHS